MKKIDIENNRVSANKVVDLIEKNVTYNHILRQPCKRLRTCQAWVYTLNFTDKESGKYFTVHALRSYNTIIAFAVYDRNEDKMFFADILRRVYGYTATSVQHISKFKRDYSLHIPEKNIYYTWRA